MEVEAEVFPLLFERICLVIIYIYIYKVDAPGGNPEVGNPEGNRITDPVIQNQVTMITTMMRVKNDIMILVL